MAKSCKYGTRRDENGKKSCAKACKRSGNNYARRQDGKCSPKDVQTIVYDLANADPALTKEELMQKLKVEFSEIGVPESELEEFIRHNYKKIKRLRTRTHLKVDVNHTRRAKQETATQNVLEYAAPGKTRTHTYFGDFSPKLNLRSPEGYDEPAVNPGSAAEVLNRSSKPARRHYETATQDVLVPYASGKTRTHTYFGDFSPKLNLQSPEAYPVKTAPVVPKKEAYPVVPKKESRKLKLAIFKKDFTRALGSPPKTMKCTPPNIAYTYKKNKTPICAPPCGENETAHWEKQENGKYAPVCKPNCAKGLTRVNGKGECVATEGSCKASGLGYSKTRKACKEPEEVLVTNKRKQAAPKKAVPQTFIENEEEDALGYDQLIAMGMAPIVARNLNSLTFIEIIKDPTIENPLDKNPQLRLDMIKHLIKEKVYSARENPEDFSNSKIIQDYIDTFDFELEDHPMKKIFDFFEKHTAEDFENEAQKKNWIKEFWMKETGTILENITAEEYEKIKERIQEKKKVLEQRIQEKKDRVQAAPVESSESENVLIDMPNEYLKPGDYAYTNEGNTCGKVLQMYEEETELNKAFNLDLDEDLINVGDSVVVLNDNHGYRRYGIIESIEYLHPEDEDDPGEVSLKMFRVNNYSIQPLTVDISLFQKKTFGEIIKHPKFDVSLMFIKTIDISKRFQERYEADQGKKALSGIAEVVPIMYEGNLTVSAADVVKLIHAVYKMPFSPSIKLDTVEYALGWDEVTSSTAFMEKNQYVLNLNGSEVNGTLLSKHECTGTFQTTGGEVTVPLYDVVDIVKGSKRNKPVNKALQANYNEYLKAYAPKEDKHVNDFEEEQDESEEAKPKKKKQVYLLEDVPDEEEEKRDTTLDAKIALLPKKEEMKSGFLDFLAKRALKTPANTSPKGEAPAKKEPEPKMSLVDRIAKLKAAKVTQPSAPEAAS